MNLETIAALSASAGGLLVGAGAVIGFLLKQGVFGGSPKNTGNPSVFKEMLAELQGIRSELSEAVRENREAHRRIEERQIKAE